MKEKIISAFKKDIFPYIDGFQIDEESDEQSDEESSEESDEESTLENKKINTTDMSELESEESEAKRRNQQEQGLKILIPN